MDTVSLTGEFTREQLEAALKEFDKPEPMLLMDEEGGYRADGDGYIGFSNTTISYDNCYFTSQGRTFRTREDAVLFAEAERFRTKCLFAAQQSWIDAGVELNWKDETQEKYAPYHVGTTEKWKVNVYWRSQASPYLFESEESCQKFIDDNEDDMYLLFVY